MTRRQAKGCLLVAIFLAKAAFVPVPRSLRGSDLARHAKEGSEDQYDWQRVGGRQTQAPDVPDIADLPDLPDFSEEGGEASVQAQVKVREVSLPDVPGIDDDLLPPGPNPWSDGGLGFLEWTGIWAALLTVVLAVGAGGSWVIARLQLEPAVAAQLLDVLFIGAICIRPSLTWTPLFTNGGAAVSREHEPAGVLQANILASGFMASDGEEKAFVEFSGAAWLCG